VYWWNVRRLKAQLELGPLPEPMAFRYAAAYATLSAVAMVPGLGANRWDVVGYIASIGITLGGTIFCYRMNGSASGRHFLDRYFALSFVVVMRLLPVFILIVLAVLSVQEVVDDVPEETTVVEAIMGILFLAVAYLRIGTHIQSVARRRVEPQDVSLGSGAAQQ
jgi:hypothetical protein